MSPTTLKGHTMTHKILRIDSSIKPANSVSRQLADEIIAKFPNATVTTRDVGQTVNPIDANWLGAVFTPQADRSADQTQIADHSDTLIAEIQDADMIVIGVAVYNFNIAAGLKNWIDQIARSGVTFNYTETGPVGLLNDKPVYLAFASDGTAAGSDIDFADRYLHHVLPFLGLKNVTTIAAQQIAFNADAAWDAARAQIAAL